MKACPSAGTPPALAAEVDGGEFSRADRLLDLAFGVPKIKVCRQKH
jgi:hypothetical protein